MTSKSKPHTKLLTRMRNLERALDDHAIVVMTDIAGTVTYVTDKYCAIAQYTRAELLGQNLRLLNSGQHSKDFIRHVWRNLQQGQIWRGQFINRAKDGSIYWLDTSIIPFLDASGKTQEYFAMCRDATEKKLAELTLLETKNQLEAIFSAIPDLIFTNARDGEYLSAHANDQNALYAKPENFLHKRISEILPKPHADLFMQAIASALNTGVVQELRYSLRMSDGKEKIFDARVARYGGDTAISVVRDITTREHERHMIELQRTSHLSNRLHETESDLRESEQRLSLAADVANLGIWIRDLVRDEIWASKHWRQLFAYNLSEKIDRASILQRVHPADLLQARQVFEASLRDTGEHQIEFRINLPHGELRWIASIWRIESDASGQPILVRGVSLDITARKLAELEIQQKQMEVMHLSRIATLGELSGAMAHELNQPLTAILSNAQAALRFLAQGKVDLNELSEILQDIVDEDKRAGDVIRHLRLLFVKGETERQKMPVNQIIAEVMRLLHNDLINQGVTLQADLATGLPDVSVDRIQLEQVLINLILNACDAMSTFPITERLIIVRSELLEQGGVRFSVVDQGTGISADGLAQLFKPFYTSKPRGMGLGLSICQNIISASGGRLWAENNSSRGASFHCILPAHTEETI
jgi:PAS domain S-box-containing protein